MACAILGACAGNPSGGGPAPRHDDTIDVLMESAVAWNRGDLEAFMEPYEVSERVSFTGRTSFVSGYDRIREVYQRNYWANGGPSDSLSFEVFEVRPLDDEAALMLGSFALTSRSTGRTTSQGIFSLVWVHTDDGWKMTHDHTSAIPVP